MREYTIRVKTAFTEYSLRQILGALGEVVELKGRDLIYPVNLMVSGELIDSIDITASSEAEALSIAFNMFIKGMDYDVIQAKDITPDMVEIDHS